MAEGLTTGGMYRTLQQEEFSYAYLDAIAAVAGYALQVKGRALDNAGIDISVEVPGEIGRVLSPRFDAQVKCISDSSIIRDEFVHYALAVHNYRRLIHPNPSCHQLLILVFVPRDTANWLDITEDQTLLKKCAYWISLKGAPPTQNTETITVQVPRKNLLTPNTLQTIMQTIAEGEAL
ncbi:MAG: DUF4365 domain-containing protein [Leptolyngbya sp. Prado105]|jgi:hypothetical protein|nr:DUF4365 domain-containing protein [Leptolyngbya sp. Prado105]